MQDLPENHLRVSGASWVNIIIIIVIIKIIIIIIVIVIIIIVELKIFE